MGLPARELLFDAVKGGALTLALYLAYVTFPVLGLAAGIFVPLPSIYYYFKRGAPAGISVFGITLTVLLVMGDKTVLLLYLLQSGLIGILLPYFYQQGKGAARALACSVGIDFLLIIVLAVAYGFWSGADLQGMLLQGIERSTEQAIYIYSRQGLSPEDLEMFSQGIKQVGTFTAKVFPALILVALGSVAAINLSIVFKIKAKLLPSLSEPEQFLTFRNPDLLVWVVIAAGFSMLFPQPEANKVGINLLVVSGFIYFIQGLAVVLAFFQRITLPSLARIVFWLALVFQPYLVLAIAFLGLFDIWGNFRTPKPKNL